MQKRLDKESDFQRNHYRIPAKKYKTRLELYPELEINDRKYNPNDFNMQLVYEYLSDRVFHRIINKTGVIRFFGESIYLGKKRYNLGVTITFDPIEKQWILAKENGTLLKTSIQGVPCEKAIKKISTSKT